ncbi:acyl-CoA dehydrogenase [Antrihabitans sp. YC3-6]|uniref:Acyl-CoA dehydrogenase n=1 Tax=Antrihabitans stalagmiti TaxID=2799499 RepID=A0A934NPK9_9NOCA|nr:acyl-CoA dehydrogenase family protein [Antrihabitans stalagmiti]MBJ8338930.1 acyl-CoA dehydrogenase [Antrihabitans stalagmiti]
MTALFNPRRPDFSEFDAPTRRIFEATIDYFETLGKRQLLEDDRERVWYADFLDFVKRERVFATLLTPAAEAAGDADKRWDTARIAMMSKILGFYGIQYWYVWQVSILGLGPIWQSSNADAKRKAADLLDSGAIFAFGLSEKEHGADIYQTDMVLTPNSRGGYSATGGKYYIGNGNLAGMVSVFGRIEGIKGPEGYVFFVADSQHKAYKLRDNVVASQMYVAAFDLEKYPVAKKDILHTGQAAFDAAINTVNVGKFNLGFGAIGIVEHSFYEALTHAENRVLFDTKVTDFAQVRRLFTDSYARLLAMKLYSERSIDYMRSASIDDRRYVLYNSIEKMTVTRQGLKAIEDMFDIISARGFEKDTYFQMGALGIMGLPKLEGTVHINLALALKFMPNYLFNPADTSLALLGLRDPKKAEQSRISDGAFRTAFSLSRRAIRSAGPVVNRLRPAKSAFAPVPTRRDFADDKFLFEQGPTKGLFKVKFHDWRPTFEKAAHLPNVGKFVEQIDALQALLGSAPPSKSQRADLDFLLSFGEMFSLIPFAELVLEQAAIAGTDDAVVDQIFDVFVRDFSTHALALSAKPTATPAQYAGALKAIQRPVADSDRFEKVWAQARAHANTYEMNP